MLYSILSPNCVMKPIYTIRLKFQLITMCFRGSRMLWTKACYSLRLSWKIIFEGISISVCEEIREICWIGEIRKMNDKIRVVLRINTYTFFALQFRHYVKEVSPVGSQWKIVVVDLIANEERTYIFDAVIIGNGWGCLTCTFENTQFQHVPTICTESTTE